MSNSVPQEIVSTLDKFFHEWKDDLSHQQSSQGAVLGKRNHKDSFSDGDNTDTSDEPGKINCLSDHNDSSRVDVRPLFVLPSPQSQRNKGSSTITPSVKAPKENRTSLVDTLISDLNEVNSIPFFDIQLPREIALVIFSHLSIKDLCTCSLVSKSWNVLSEDNVLWYRIYLKLSPDMSVDMDAHWKTVVKDIVVGNKKVLQNWKERKCGLLDYQPDNAGVLITAAFSQSTLISCYTSGLAVVWNITDQSGAVPVKWLSPDNGSHLTCCAANNSWGVIGTRDGRVHVIDVESSSEVQCLVQAGAVCAVDVLCEDRLVIASLATQTRFDDSTVYKTTVHTASDDGTWDRVQLACDAPVNQMRLLSLSECDICLLYSTSTTLTLHPLHSSTPTHILSPSAHTSYVSCFDNNSTQVACGTSTFGYKVQVYDLQSASLISSFRGHNQHVSSVSIFKDNPRLLASGSADKCVRAFDGRTGSLPVVQLYGHGASVSCVQMDDWKVVSGSLDGHMIVWDQRMNTELWRSHERHPVTLCRFDQNCLVACFVPVDKQPVIETGNPFICHRRHRGLVRLYDFSIDVSVYSNVLPFICTSAFNEPSASFYNLDLKYPYDSIP